ncbi:hypothetical protein M9458_056408 [Cirrhinus mrigala]|uniref:Reverse transcriptase domain-containing protein n=1 Tax=Cirrhinus mrigala TaxID=683832 RepID=A0ABD0MDX8_CIRMR
MKSLEKLVLAYLKDITGPLLNPLQFAYRANRSVDDAVNLGLHLILQHLDRPGTYVRILFVDFSSAFNTIIPTLLQTKLNQLSVPSSICQWITSFLTDSQQLGCVLSPLLFSLDTNDCTSKDPSVKLLKFADDTTLIGLIQDGEESAYRQEVEQLAVWCSLNNLELNTLKTVEMIIDFRRNPPALPPLSIMDSTVAAVETFKFLGSIISRDLKWDIRIDSIAKKPQQSLYFLRQLRKLLQPAAGAAETVLHSRHQICSLHINNCLVWLSYKIRHQKITENGSAAERINGAPLPTLQELYTSRVRKRAQKITLDPSHPCHPLFELFHKYQDSQT